MADNSIKYGIIKCIILQNIISKFGRNPETIAFYDSKFWKNIIKLKIITLIHNAIRTMGLSGI